MLCSVLLPCTEKEQGEGEAGEETEGRRGEKKVNKKTRRQEKKKKGGVGQDRKIRAEGEVNGQRKYK